MIKWILQKIVGSKHQRELKRMRPMVARINRIEESLQSESREAILKKVEGWQKHLRRYLPLEIATKRQIEQLDADQLSEMAAAVGERMQSLRDEFPSLPERVTPDPESIENAKESFRSIEDRFPELRRKYLEEILPEAFAVVKNAARRLVGETVEVCDQPLAWDMVHFDVQLVGGIALHRKMIAEMQTGEGKTLVATLPVFLNALTGLGVHVVTVNDYLARRDSEWMGAVFKYLGLTVGCIQNQQAPPIRREQYCCDITYGTNSEFGFDYLRDNGMASSCDEQVQRSHYFAIIDEAKRHLDNGDEEEAGRCLFKIKLGQPRNRQLMRSMEDPDLRRLVQKSELSLYQDTQKKELFAIKEELYFTIDEKGNDADLMEMGREFLSPGDPEAFVLPDLVEAFAEIDANPELDEKMALEAKEQVEANLDRRGEKMHSISQLLKAYCLLSGMLNTWYRKTR